MQQFKGDLRLLCLCFGKEKVESNNIFVVSVKKITLIHYRHGTDPCRECR
jgi:hypothetical protein